MHPERAIHHIAVDTPIGTLTLFADEDGLIAVETGVAGEPQIPSALLREADRQLTAYFDRRLETFDLPFKPEGPSRQQDIWQAMAAIPFGTVCTYGALAAQVQSSARAVGGACARNPLPIFIPCHRVLPKSGGVGAYSFAEGTETKLRLLDLEGADLPLGTTPSTNDQIALPL